MKDSGCKRAKLSLGRLTLLTVRAIECTRIAMTLRYHSSVYGKADSNTTTRKLAARHNQVIHSMLIAKMTGMKCQISGSLLDSSNKRPSNTEVRDIEITNKM